MWHTVRYPKHFHWLIDWNHPLQHQTKSQPGDHFVNMQKHFAKPSSHNPVIPKLTRDLRSWGIDVKYALKKKKKKKNLGGGGGARGTPKQREFGEEWLQAISHPLADLRRPLHHKAGERKSNAGVYVYSLKWPPNLILKLRRHPLPQQQTFRWQLNL